MGGHYRRLWGSRWLVTTIVVALTLGSGLSLTFTAKRGKSRVPTTFLLSSLVSNDEEGSPTAMNTDDRPFEQRTQGPRPARRLNNSFKYLYRHDYNLNVTDPLTYLMQEGGYTAEQVYDMNRSFPPLLTLSVQRQLHPKMRFLKETLGAHPEEEVKIPPQYFGARLERILAPRHAFLVYTGLPHGRALFETSSTEGTNTTLWYDFLLSCRKTKRFAVLCQSWQRAQGRPATVTPKQIEAFDALFGRGLMSAARNTLVQDGNTWPVDHINITSSHLIRLMIQHGAPVQERDYRGVSLLHWAAGTGNADALQELLPHIPDAVWTVTGRDRATPLHWAAAGATAREFGTGGHVEVCRALLAHVPAVSAKSYVNQLTLDGNSALMWAAWSGTLETVKLLVRNRADADVMNRNGCAVAHWAASGGNVEVCRYLADTVGVDFTVANHGGNTPLTHAVAFGRASVVEWLRGKFAKDVSEDQVAFNLAQDFVLWTNGEDRRKQVLQLFEDCYALDDDGGEKLSEGDPSIIDIDY
jgi:ankyrin repeat protein